MERGSDDHPLSAPEVAADRLGGLEAIELAAWDGGPAGLATEVRLGRLGDRLGVEFRCRYADLHVDHGLPRDRPSPGLWNHDVVEVFISDRAGGLPYREIEASPLGQWLALAFDGVRHPAAAAWSMRPDVSATIEAASFTVSILLPIDELRTGQHPPEWRVGLYRITGRPPNRLHMAHRTNGTAKPDFHQPATWSPLLLGSGSQSSA